MTEDIGLSQVQLEYPLDGVYEEGDEARLFFAITNTGTDPARLVDIRRPDFSGVQVETAEGAGLPLEVDPNDNLCLFPLTRRGVQGRRVRSSLGRGLRGRAHGRGRRRQMGRGGRRHRP